MRPTLTLAVLAAAAACVPACATAPGPGSGRTGAGPLDLPAESPEIRNHPALRARLRATPHGYFRFVNAAFTREVCRRFAGVKEVQPAVTLHGDCHLEQYSVTEMGRGLTDFDDSAGGPAFVDLVRFGVSLHLAARQRGWHRAGDDAYQAFRRGYRNALREPRTEAPVPAPARRIANGFKADRAASLARSEALMETLPEQEPEIDAARREMVLTQVARNSGLPESFFRIKKIGLLRVGIGSALSAKYLLRVEGPSEAPDDDVMLEAKEVLDRAGLGCIQVTPGPSRIFTGEQRLAYQPFRFPGVIHVGGRTFWVHAWTDHYVELDILNDLRSPDELDEVAYDVGVQLGRGHPKRVDAEGAILLRVEILRTLPEARLRHEIAALTEETLRAWGRFKAGPPAGS